LTQDA